MQTFGAGQNNLAKFLDSSDPDSPFGWSPIAPYERIVAFLNDNQLTVDLVWGSNAIAVREALARLSDGWSAGVPGMSYNNAGTLFR